MKTLITNLRELLANSPTLDYAKDSGYVSMDVADLVKTSKFPFFNVVPGRTRIMKADAMRLGEIERHTHQVTIQLATRSMKMNVSIMGDGTTTGILDFATDVWTVLKTDRTVNGAVDGMIIFDIDSESSIEIEPIAFEDDQGRMIIGTEITVDYYKDIEE